MIYVSFSTIYTAWQNQDKNLAFCVQSSDYFFFSMLYSNTILYGKPNVGSYTGFAESKLPNYENFRFCLCGGKKKRLPNFKIPVIYEVWQMPLKIHHLV